MARVETELFINAPVDRVFQMWSGFENQPQFMQHVKEVRKTGENSYHFVLEGMGQTVEYDATVTEMKPNEKVSWQATSGLQNRGMVEFRPEGPGCRLHLVWEEQAGGQISNVAEQLTGFAKSTIDEDLQRFKQLCEQQAQQAA